MKIKHSLAIVMMSVLLAGCLMEEPKHTMTPLEIQSLQTREYEANKDVVFRSIVSVLQDLGYTVTNADANSGLISAQGAASSNSFASKLFSGQNQVSQTKATAFVEQIGSRTKARLNFVDSFQSSSETGQSDRNDKPILDAKIYENAFDKIETAIFIRTNA